MKWFSFLVIFYKFLVFFPCFLKTMATVLLGENDTLFPLLTYQTCLLFFAVPWLAPFGLLLLFVVRSYAKHESFTPILFYSRMSFIAMRKSVTVSSPPCEISGQFVCDEFPPTLTLTLFSKPGLVWGGILNWFFSFSSLFSE